MQHRLTLKLFLSLIAWGLIAWLANGSLAGGSLAAAAHAAPLRLLHVGFPILPPYVEGEQAGQPVGSYIRRSLQVIEAAGYQVDAQALPVARAVVDLISGELDVSFGHPTFAALQGKVAVSQFRFLEITLKAYSLTTSPTYRGLSSLANQEVTWILGFDYPGVRPFVHDPANKVTLIEITGYDVGLSLLANHRADYFVAYALAADRAILQFDQVRFNSAVIESVPIHVLASLAVPDHDEIIMRIDQSYRRLEQSGELAAVE